VRAGALDSDLVRGAMDEMGELELEDLDLGDLVDAFRLIVESVNFDRLGAHEIELDETPIEVHAERILGDLAERDPSAPPATLRDLVVGRTRAEMIGAFLALLVLVRDQRVRFEPHGEEVELSLTPGPEREAQARTQTGSVPGPETSGA